MADGRSAEEAAATDLCDDESRVPRERHKKRVLDNHQSHVMHNNNNNNNNNHHCGEEQQQQQQQQQKCLVIDTSSVNSGDSEISCVSDDCLNNKNKNKIKINKNDHSDVFNVDCREMKRITPKASSNNLKFDDDISDVIINGERHRVLNERNKKMIVMIGDYGDSENNNNGTATVVDAAAAAVAVSAIPETIKDIKKSSSLIKDTKTGGKRCADDIVARLGCGFKGQIRNTEDNLVGPCGKKRCADRYDSSESSDSGVAISCGECSSSGTSDITEPGSPCSTSSDEGVAIGGTATSPLPSLPKLAPPTTSTHNGTRPQWPWTPPLAATPCSTNYKRLRGEPEPGTLPKSAAAADPSVRLTKTNNKLQQQTTTQQQQQQQRETQGKITEYFKTQIKPQQPKTKKNSSDMSVLIAKSSPEFRRPPTVQRNKGGLAKYLGVVLPNSRPVNDWEVRTVTISPSTIINKKLPLVTPRVTVTKLDKKLISKALPGIPISEQVLSSITGCKISSLRLTSEASPKATIPPTTTPTPTPPPTTTTAISSSLPSAPLSNHINEPVGIDFTSFPTKKIVNENNNITHAKSTQDPLTRLSSGLDPTKQTATKTKTTTTRRKNGEEEEEEDESKPILSAPTTIRFPARVPTKNTTSNSDSGFCQWDKCNADFECSGALLEHLQTAHINTQTGGDNFVCHWQGCKVKGRTSCSRRWLERHVLSHGGNKPFRCIVDGCGSRFSSQPALERHVNNHFNQSETSSSSSRRSCENGKLVRRNGKKLRYRRQPWSARLFDYIDTGVMEGLQHRLLELAKTRTQGQLAETPGDSMALTSQILARRVEMDGKTKVLLRWYPRDIEPDEWVAESQVQKTKHVRIRQAATASIDEVNRALYPALHGGAAPPSPITRVKQRRKPVKNS